MTKNAHYKHFSFHAFLSSWRTGGWLNIKLTSPASRSLSSPSYWFSVSTVILFSVKNKLSFCCPLIMKHEREYQVASVWLWMIIAFCIRIAYSTSKIQKTQPRLNIVYLQISINVAQYKFRHFGEFNFI